MQKLQVFGLACLFLGIVVFPGCTTTKITSEVLSDSFDKNNIHHVLATSNYDTREFCEIVETKIQEDFAKKTRCQCTRSIDVLGQETGTLPEELLDRVEGMGFDAILSVGPTEFLNMTSQPHLMSLPTGGFPLLIPYSKPWIFFRSQLVATSTGEVIWHAVGNSEGGALIGYGTLVRAGAGKTTDRLIEDGIIEGAEN